MNEVDDVVKDDDLVIGESVNTPGWLFIDGAAAVVLDE
jgi:hypothetical protein